MVRRGSFYTWVNLPFEIDTKALIPKVIVAKVAFVPGSAFYANGFGSWQMHFSCCHPTPERICEGVKALGNVIEQEMSHCGTALPQNLLNPLTVCANNRYHPIMKVWLRKLILLMGVAALCITTLPSSQATESDAQNFVVTFHRSYIDWFWKVPPSVDVTNYTIAITGGGSDLTFSTTDSYFVPADHGVTNPNNDKEICVSAHLSDGWGRGPWCREFDTGKPLGQVIDFGLGPAPIYKINGVFQSEIIQPYRDFHKAHIRNFNISGSFTATDSVFLNTAIYYKNSPFIARSTRCDFNKKCDDTSKVVSDSWGRGLSPNYITATVSTPETCQVIRSEINEDGEMATGIRPLRDNVLCSVIATSRVPFLAQPDTTATFTVHFQKLPYSLLVQLPNGEVNPTVGTTTFLFAQSVPYWWWPEEPKYSQAKSPFLNRLNFSKEFRSLTPKTCSIKRPELYTLELRGISVGKCQVELSSPGWQLAQPDYFLPFRLLELPRLTDKFSSIVSDPDTRTLNFNISKPKVSKDVATKYPCMVADPAASLYTIFNLVNKSAVPKNCQKKNEFIVLDN